MAVNEDLSAYSTTAASNTPAGGSNIGPDLDNHLRDIKRNVRRVAERYQGTTTPEAFRGREWIDTSATASTKLEVKLNDGSNEVVITEIDTSAGTSTPVVHGTAIPKGSMAVQAANAVDITGGEINGTIGGTTPDAGNFTTLGASGVITGESNLTLEPSSGGVTSTLIGYGAATTLRMRQAGGTKSSPSAITDNSVMLNLHGEGHDGTTTGLGAYIQARSSEAWSVGNHGSRLAFATTPAGSETNAVIFTLKADGTGQFENGLRLQSGQTLLDQYDEGTFTPKIWDASLSDGEGQTYTTQLGYWTRIGNRFFISGEVGLSSLGTLTTSDVVRLGGFPVICSATARDGLQIQFAASLGQSAAGLTVSGRIASSTDYATLFEWGATTGHTNFTLAELTANGRLEFSGNFEV